MCDVNEHPFTRKEDVEHIVHLESQCRKWEQLFNIACHDRDSWQQQCETLETINQRLKEQVRRLKTYERLMVIDTKVVEGELAEVKLSDRSVTYLPAIYLPEEAERPVKGFIETARNEGQDSREASDDRRPGGETEGLC
jgi:hypothetical protein